RRGKHLGLPVLAAVDVDCFLSNTHSMCHPCCSRQARPSPRRPASYQLSRLPRYQTTQSAPDPLHLPGIPPPPSPPLHHLLLPAHPTPSPPSSSVARELALPRHSPSMAAWGSSLCLRMFTAGMLPSKRSLSLVAEGKKRGGSPPSSF